MKYPRVSGILLHPTSLPGRLGIGVLGQEAYRFADFLYETRQRLWQVLPLGPTGYGDSPYQVFSAFAGNPLLISLEQLAEEGWLSEDDWKAAPSFPAAEVDYGALIQFKLPLLCLAFDRFEAGASASSRQAFKEFCQRHAVWLDDYALFMAVKEAHAGVAWHEWEPSIALRRPEALAHWRQSRAREVERFKFWQFAFFKQWLALKQYCHEHEIQIMGDIPIFVARDSTDVWAHPELFQLDAQGKPTVVAGVPPDYFSATGQLWGNPIYRWDVMEASGYRWWIERFRSTFELVDISRIDHFLGFEAYWEVPAQEVTAVKGRWVKGPGARLFKALRRELGKLPIVAENLGVVTPEAERLRKQFGIPGMAVLQFAFGSDAQQSDFMPHNYPRNRLVYTGTHDNDTTVGWWTSQAMQDSTRSTEDIRKEREFALKYLGSNGDEIHWTFIRAALSSVANLAIVPLQDVLGLGSEARMNVPGRPGGNWRWRYTPDLLTEEIRNQLRELTIIYGRASNGGNAESKKAGSM